jgi:hypothetical protein
LHVTTQVPPSPHATWPLPDGGAAHALVHEPHVASFVGSTHVPPQLSEVGAVQLPPSGVVLSGLPVSALVSREVSDDATWSDGASAPVPVSACTPTSPDVPSAVAPSSPASVSAVAEHVGSWLQSTPAQP